MADVSGKKVAVLVHNYFEQPEFTGPIDALKAAGATVEVIGAGAEDGKVQGLNHVEMGDTFDCDKSLDEADYDEYDAVVLPGGAVNADHLRMENKAREWVRKACEDGKPLAVICHAPWVLASAGIAKDKQLTSYYTIQDDMRNAGADWVDQECVIDGNLITSRNPDDIPTFNNALIAALES
ncbi:MAG TPA: type 1 glutamine amidotransferase domain-containing protein [Candidatus Saccharimonadales bacterium]|nr:type 1 glutamine amidotransferase domain-containing protein [Candidatus Saccharimonadales bacterium]